MTEDAERTRRIQQRGIPPGEMWSVTLTKDAIEPALPMTSDAALQAYKSFVIASDEQQDFAAQLLREVKEQWRSVEAERKKIITPINQAKDAAQGLFKPVLKSLEEIEQVLKQKIAGYLASKQAANVAALQAASVAPTAMAASRSIDHYEPVQAPQGISVRDVWRFEVTDPDLVPREFCCPDPKKIGSVDPERVQIPGVRFFKEQVVTARSK